MHIFCDESGGHAEGTFLVSAVSIDPCAARKYMKTIRKISQQQGEIKGHKLTPLQRSKIFDVIFENGLVSAVAITQKTEMPGAFLLNSIREKDVWAEMVSEASCSIIPPKSEKIYITPDAGRYKKSDMKLLKPKIIQSVRTLLDTPNLEIELNYAHSHETPGVQVADIVANTVFQSLTDCSNHKHSSELVQHAINNQKWDFQMSNASLVNIAPEWAQK